MLYLALKKIIIPIISANEKLKLHRIGMIAISPTRFKVGGHAMLTQQKINQNILKIG